MTTSDAADLLYGKRRDRDFYDVVDLDPYGSAAPFLDGAIQALTNGGLLCVTYTDMAVLCSRTVHIPFYKYASVPL